ncbi:MAG: DUF362 domain-containing protein [Pseudodesulfovibrio sp.]|uniref:DUF362 domain-containing protein n=1 Tax=Pseudodesulfovibrio aespoeensis (strain ATCC 700646 / DSM 10631 / Aspo-2) TaxID=643562 RepID=E6VVS7_PSEA9|nr:MULTISPECIES: DUF362 domain-containing protein [Pseudodesulfovibrio]MBU4192194.1 DUF362 domain-containing protein [Pseudomonadota bacterium]ADU61279.1 hypothetical protein Daes_0252 [Pseudodesulfovibrio aespoeensis Aspo-2]MBU4243939.1 DUF362 domain-containing protein [Pseudomonadota bacterium]MBU4379324.1 DUF362 domain-containing protein [Pseudomonadota bacterium]MBU4476770.1 DUF362 domain-containing protein [Pseudomonadota bacterium]
MPDTCFTRIVGRRHCLQTLLALGAGALAWTGFTPALAARPKSKVVVVRTGNRVKGVSTAMAQFDLNRFSGASVAIKANYNSADPFPASTHIDTLRTMIATLKEVDAGPMTLVERSGMGNTPEVLETMGVNVLAEELGFKVVVMDDLDGEDSVLVQPEGSHWKRGFLLARPFVTADRVVQTCCLKTHQYGGHFSMALKNAVGAVAKHDPGDGYNYMGELHRSPDQRSLIAEISQVFRNDLIVMDAMKAFITGGPHAGKEVEPGVIVAGIDPVAVDAVGVAILRMYPTTAKVLEGPVFGQEQIRRAAELGLGARSAEDIELVHFGAGSAEFAQGVREKLGA